MEKILLKNIVICLLIMIITYAFLSSCNWNLNAGEWNGFSCFLLGMVGIVLLSKLITVGLIFSANKLLNKFT